MFYMQRLNAARKAKQYRAKGWMPEDIKGSIFHPKHSVYLIHAIKYNLVVAHYVGFTTRDAEIRFAEHKAGLGRKTKRFIEQDCELELVHVWKGHTIGFEKAIHIISERTGYDWCHCCRGRSLSYRADEFVQCLSQEDRYQCVRAVNEWKTQMEKQHTK